MSGDRKLGAALAASCVAVALAVWFAGCAGTALAAETTSTVPTITVTAVGDMCFASAPGRYVASRGARAPFSAARSLLASADVTVGNLECPLSRRGSAVRGKKFTFEGSPKVADALAWAGFDFVAMGNNHARDYGPVALMDTVANLERAGVAHAGAGRNRAAAWSPAIIERNGARIAYLSISQIGPADFSATSSRPGTAYTMNATQVKRAIRAAHTKADYVIVSFHWGVEYARNANARQVAWGRAAVDAGADLVLSHHPHVIQGVEFYKHKLIAYSLGNFIFSPGHQPGHDSMVLDVTLAPSGVSGASAHPVFIDGNGRPTVAKGANARRILRIIGATSRARRTRTRVSKGVVYLSR